MSINYDVVHDGGLYLVSNDGALKVSIICVGVIMLMVNVYTLTVSWVKGDIEQFYCSVQKV